MDKQKVWSFIKKYNKYVVALAIFGGIIVFLDENSVIRRLQYENEIRKLNKEITKYQAEYEESTEKLNELNSNPEAIERIAREKYLMKKPNEDIFIFDK